VADFRVGNQAHDAVRHAEPCAKNRDNRDLFVCEGLYGGFADGRFDLDLLEFEVTSHLVCHEHGKLVDEFAERFAAGVFVAQQRELMLHEGMVDGDYFSHDEPP